MGAGSKHNKMTLEGSFSAVSKPILQVKSQFAASFFEIYKICALLHRSKLRPLARIGNLFAKILANSRQN